MNALIQKSILITLKDILPGNKFVELYFLVVPLKPNYTRDEVLNYVKIEFLNAFNKYKKNVNAQNLIQYKAIKNEVIRNLYRKGIILQEMNNIDLKSLLRQQ